MCVSDDLGESTNPRFYTSPYAEVLEALLVLLSANASCQREFMQRGGVAAVVGAAQPRPQLK